MQDLAKRTPSILILQLFIPRATQFSFVQRDTQVSLTFGVDISLSNDSIDSLHELLIDPTHSCAQNENWDDYDAAI